MTRHLKQVTKIAFNYRGQRGPALRQEVFDILGPLAPAVATESGGIRYYVSTKDTGLGRDVFVYGSYDQSIMNYLIDLAGVYVGRPSVMRDRTFLDIGANIGTSTLPALLTHGAGDVIAFEPDPENFKLLRCNIIANGVEHRVHAYNIGLSNRSGEGTLECAEKSWGDHRIRMQDDLPDGLFRESTRSTVSVPLARFDDLEISGPLDLDRLALAWMDVQGHEGHVLAGALSLLQTDVPVAIEYWPYGLQRAGGLSLLHDLVAQHFSRVIDVRASMAGSGAVDLPADELRALSACYPGEQFTDLLLLK